jgi:acyl-CoA thioester hydrolase
MSLSGFPITLDLPVLWSDQDLFGHVNNVTFLRWFECSRVKYWDDTGMRKVMTLQECGPILASVRCHYRRQLLYPDTIQVGARIRELGRKSLTMEHHIFSRAQQAVVADGESIVVVFNYRRQVGRVISPELQAVIERAEGRRFERLRGGS